MDKEINQIGVIRTLASEDLREDDYVTVTRVTVELLPFCLDDPWRAPPVHRVTATPAWAGQPFRVVRVCVPFVLVRDALGDHHTLDTRRHHLARLDEAYGRKAFKAFERDQARRLHAKR